MRSLIAESGRSGDPIKIITLSREPGNPGWTYMTRAFDKLYMENLDNNQFKPIFLLDIADNTVAPIDAENVANHVYNNEVHTINNCEWTDEQKNRIVEIDREERRKGKNCMKRIKVRWEVEYPTIRRSSQNLIDNARRFGKEGWGRHNDNVNEIHVESTTNQKGKNLDWNTEMKIILITIDEEERAKGRGFMKRVKERWDLKYPEHQGASWQKLRDSAARFKREPENMKPDVCASERGDSTRGN
jgi:hypothetical protein